jgi:hypothetical protein
MSDFLTIGCLLGKHALDGDDKIALVDQVLAGLGLAPFGIVGDGFGDTLALDQVLDDELARAFSSPPWMMAMGEPRRSA